MTENIVLLRFFFKKLIIPITIELVHHLIYRTIFFESTLEVSGILKNLKALNQMVLAIYTKIIKKLKPHFQLEDPFNAHFWQV